MVYTRAKLSLKKKKTPTQHFSHSKALLHNREYIKNCHFIKFTNSHTASHSILFYNTWMTKETRKKTSSKWGGGEKKRVENETRLRTLKFFFSLSFFFFNSSTYSQHIYIVSDICVSSNRKRSPIIYLYSNLIYLPLDMVAGEET